MSVPETISRQPPCVYPTTPPHREPITGSCVWQRDDFSDPADWSYHLTPATLAELARSIRRIRELGKDITTLTAADFEIPSFTADAARLREELEQGRGFVVIKGLPVEQYTDDEARMIYWGIGAFFGATIPQNIRGDRLYSVRDEGYNLATDYGAVGVRGSRHNQNRRRKCRVDFIRSINWRRALLMIGASLGACVVSNLWLQSPGQRWGIARAAQQPDFSEIDRRLQETITKGTFSGIGLMVVTSDKTLYKKAFGADTTDTKHLLASATKYPSAIAMMTLVDSNLIKLDDPIKKYLPQFGPVRGAITIRQLLAQTHGMPANHPCIPQPAQRNGNGMTLEQCVNQIAQDDSVVFPPGSKQEYMPAVSYHIMGRIAEVVTGKEWAALFKERVADPLEMTTFNYGTPANKNPRIGGGGESALQDYGNLLQMSLAGGVFKGRRVLSEASVAEMQKDQSGGAPFTPSAVSRGLQYGYGLAWWFDLLNASKQPVQFSIPGAFGAIPWLNREAGYGAFLLVQDELVESWDVYTTISPILNSMLRTTPRVATSVSAASYQQAPLAAESIVSAFGSSMATTTLAASSNPLPVTLAGTTVKMRDSAGVERQSPLFFVSPAQINYLLPAGTANGQATVTITSGDGALSTGAAQIATVAPGLFTADASGRGLAAAVALRVKADGAQSFEPVAQFDAAQNKFVAVPIDLGPDLGTMSDQVFLLLFGTGIRNRSALSAVAAKLGGVDCQAPYAGAQGGFAGLDQINVRLSRSLIGRGEVDVVLTVDGQAANIVKVQLK